jgi:hypothetical protein
MAQSGFTPIQLYFSSTATNVPLAANLANGELAINITDGKLFYKDNASAVQVIGWKVVPATAGGTGQTSYAVGDLLYANTTTTLAKLPDVATGNALISGGVGVAPAWGKIGLTTHVSGTLPIANGGTNGTATPTNGGISYGTGSAYAFSAAGTSGNVLISGGAGAPTWTGGPTFTATTKVNMSEAYFGLDAATLGTGKLWYLISGGGGNITPGFFSIYNGTNGNKVFTIAPSTSEQFVTDTSGNFQLVAGNLVVSNGKGIDFSATPGTGTSELLADYEEGTYTATLTTGSGSITVNTSFNTLAYTKIGRMMYVTGYITASSVSAPSGFLRLNLPSTITNLSQGAEIVGGQIIVQGSASGVANGFSFIGSGGNAYVSIYISTGNALADAGAQILTGNATDIYISLSYVSN